jgi:hypothetical protein
MARSQLREALFGVGAAELVLLYVGIHNAWDGLAYHFDAHRADQRPERRPHGPPSGGMP